MNVGDDLVGTLRQFIKAEVVAITQSAQQAAQARYVTVALAATLTGLFKRRSVARWLTASGLKAGSTGVHPTAASSLT